MKYIDSRKTLEEQASALNLESSRVVRDRNKAHEMDIQWTNFKTKYNLT